MKKIFFPLLLLYSVATAQPSIQWRKAYGGNGSELINDIRPTADKGWIIAGSSTAANADVTSAIKGDADVWIVKTDGNGTILWNTAFGGSNTDLPVSVRQTMDGGYIVLAQTASANGDITGNHGFNDTWVVKLNTVGNIEWSKCLGGSDDEWPVCIIQTPDGGYIAASRTVSTNGDITGNHGGSDVWLCKLSAAGVLQWQRCYGGSGYEYIGAIIPLSDGNYVFAGSSYSADGDVSSNKGNADVWLVKIDPSGNIIWDKSHGGTSGDVAKYLVETSDQGFAITGHTNSTDLDVQTQQAGTNLLIVRTASDGSLTWARAIGGSGTDVGEAIIERLDKRLIVMGHTNSTDGDISGTHGGTDIWVAQLQGEGSVSAQLAIGGSLYDYPGAMFALSDTSVIVAGSTQSTDGDVAGSGFHTGTNPQSADGWVLKVKIPSLLHVETMKEDNVQVKVYPTMTTGDVHIMSGNGLGSLHAVLLNAVGQVVKDIRAEGQKTTLQLKELPAGVYILHVMAGGKDNTYKISYQP